MAADIDIVIPGYELLDTLGAGGMANVYLGVQSALDRKVAIKVLKKQLSDADETGEFKERFFYEGKVLAKVSHPNIVSIYDIGETAEGLLYMAMEYVRGGDLSDRLKQRNLTVDEAIQICGQVALALHTVHLQNIVHRDLKPSNILFRDEFTPVLTDFGIARQTDVDHGLTQTGHIIGTLQYMSPEQIRGQHIDHRSDIYSLGLMFYRLLVGRLPFTASGHYELSKQQCEEPPPPLPPELSEIQPIMDGMLAKDPNDRFQTALEFAKAIQNLNVTDEEYATELTQQTRVFDSSAMNAPSFRTRRPTAPGTGSFTGRQSAQQTGGTAGGTAMTAVTGTLKKPWAWGPLALVAVAVIVWLAFFSGPGGGDMSEQERRIVDGLIQRVNGYIATNQIDEAVTAFEQARQRAPEYEPVLEASSSIADFFVIDAQLAIDDGSLEQAARIIERGLGIAPDNEQLVEMDMSVGALVREQQRQAEIARYLELADTYLRVGQRDPITTAALAARYAGDDNPANDAQISNPEEENALSAYRQVLELQQLNEVATRGINEIQQQMVSEVRSTLAAGEIEAAQQEADQVAALFPDSEALATVQGSIAERIREREEAQRVEALLLIAQQQETSGQLVEPEGDNALDTYIEVLNLRSDNERALAGLQRIGEDFRGRAQAALQAGNFQQASVLAGNGLLAVPEDGQLLRIQQEATSQLGERERAIQDALQQAQRLVQSGQYLPPGENALDAFNAVLELDPGNDQAERALARLPDQVFEEASQMQRISNFTGARDLLQRAQQTFPAESRFANLISELDTQIAEQAREDRLQDMLARSGQLIAARPMTAESIDAAAEALKAIFDEFPNNSAANRQLGDLTAAVATEARRISAGANEQAGFMLIDRALSHFAGNATLASARAEIEQALESRLAAERARIAAMSGKLAIDAMPWGEVLEIRNGAGEAQPLPDEATTPLVISLLEGDYTVTVRGDNGGQPRREQVSVRRQDVTTARVDFGSMTADQYFERSGW